MDTIEAVAPPPPEDGWDWGMLEIMGHRRHAGRYREEERFGSKMIRIDVPKVIIDRGDEEANLPFLLEGDRYTGKGIGYRIVKSEEPRL